MHTPTPVHTRAQPRPEGSFAHTPRPAQVAHAPYSHQRRYGADLQAAYGLHLRHDRKDPCRCEVEVFRNAHDDVAELKLSLGLDTRANITVRMTPAELRELAARALDAAHDIEAHPAAALMESANTPRAA